MILYLASLILNDTQLCFSPPKLPILNDEARSFGTAQVSIETAISFEVSRGRGPSVAHQ